MCAGVWEHGLQHRSFWWRVRACATSDREDSSMMGRSKDYLRFGGVCDMNGGSGMSNPSRALAARRFLTVVELP